MLHFNIIVFAEITTFFTLVIYVRNLDKIRYQYFKDNSIPHP